jgi:hypothetical protein
VEFTTTAAGYVALAAGNVAGTAAGYDVAFYGAVPGDCVAFVNTTAGYATGYVTFYG